MDGVETWKRGYRHSSKQKDSKCQQLPALALIKQAGALFVSRMWEQTHQKPGMGGLKSALSEGKPSGQGTGRSTEWKK